MRCRSSERMRPLFVVLCLSIALSAHSHASACKSITIMASVSAGQSFEKAISKDLIFRLTSARLGPDGKLNGWEMSIVSAQSDTDYIYPVNPPLRFNGSQTFGASYGETASASLANPHEVRFLRHREDYDKIKPLLDGALWPYSAPHPDSAQDEYVTALGKTITGRLVVTVTSYHLEAGADSLRDMKFRADFSAPADFEFLAELNPKESSDDACSSRQ